MLHGKFIGATTQGMVCLGKFVKWHSSTYAKPKWQPCIGPTTSHICLSQYPSSHIGFPHGVLVSTHNQVQRKESKKFHGELLKELKQVVASRQPALVKIPTDETEEIINGRTYWQQKVRNVAYSHLDMFFCNFKHHTSKQ